MALFTGIESTFKKISGAYCGIDGVARKITSMYSGKDGVTEIIFSSAQNAQDDGNIADWVFTTNATDTLITSYIGSDYEITLPTFLNGKSAILQSATGTRGIFKNYTSNFSIKINENVRFQRGTMSNAFNSCNTLKSFSGNIPKEITNMRRAFYMCNSMTSWNANIPNGPTDMVYTFAFVGTEAASFDSPYPVIPSSATNLQGTFFSSNFKGNIYIDSYNAINISNFIAVNIDQRTNIYVKGGSPTNTFFYQTNQVDKSLIGRNITWTDITNGYYNSFYNIYVYYNY